MFDKLNEIIAGAGSRLDRTAHGLIDRVTKFAGSIVVLLVFGLLAAVALLTLCAAAVVALVPALGIAAALAAVGAGLLFISIIVMLATSTRFKAYPATLPGPQAQSPATARASTPPLENSTAEVKPSPNPSSATHSVNGFEIPKIDPLLVTAAAGAALALFGPARIARTAGRATAAAAIVRSVMPLLPSVMAGLRSAVTAATTPTPPKQPAASPSTY